jgi:hypothetical protein
LSRGLIDESPEEYRMGRVLDVWRMDEFH